MDNFVADEGKTLGITECVWYFFFLFWEHSYENSYILFNYNDNMLVFLIQQNNMLLVILFLNHFPPCQIRTC